MYLPGLVEFRLTGFLRAAAFLQLPFAGLHGIKTLFEVLPTLLNAILLTGQFLGPLLDVGLDFLEGFQGLVSRVQFDLQSSGLGRGQALLRFVLQRGDAVPQHAVVLRAPQEERAKRSHHHNDDPVVRRHAVSVLSSLYG